MLFQRVGVDLIERCTAFRNAAPVDDSFNRSPMLLHPFEDDARVQSCPLNCSEQLIGRGVVEVPSECNAAKRRIDEDGSIAVVPRETKKSGLAGFIAAEGFGKLFDGRTGALCDRMKDIAYGGKSRLNPNSIWINRSGNDTANSGNKLLLLAHADDAG